MAATRLITMHQNKGKSVAKSLSDRTDYTKNGEKTENGQFISSYACQAESVDEEFMLSKREYERLTGRHPKGNIIAYQIRQSFKPGEITPEVGQLWNGLFVAYDKDVATVYDLRFPRIIISLMAGAAVSVAGVIFQSVLKNPLADPGIIGISSGAGFFSILITVLFPTFYFMTPIFACIGGLIAFLLVYSLSWKGGLSPLRIILVGVSVSAMFSGLATGLNYGTGSEMSGVASIVNGNITMKTWEDVHMLAPYVLIGLVLAVVFSQTCNLMTLEDKTIRGLGIDVNAMRIWLSVLACILACSATAVVGTISFLGLIVPHIGRLLVGSNHKKLLPFSMLLGAFTFLFADTLGRTIAVPHEIPAAILMSVLGGPFFIILLRRSKKYGNS